MLVGLSLVVASFTLFLYKVSLSTWRRWFRLKSQATIKPPPPVPEIELQEIIEEELKDVAKTTSFDTSAVAGAQLRNGGAVTPADVEPKLSAPALSAPEASKPVIAPATAKEELDRKAMPPPPFLRPPTKLAAPVSPKFSKKPAEDDDDDYVPSFPAINSAQRAGGHRSIPRLNPAPVAQPPLRSINDLTNTQSVRLPILNRGPAVNRGGPAPNRGPSVSSGLVPPPSHNSIPAKPRKKVELMPGHSPLDWATLSANPRANLCGLPEGTPFLKVPPSLLKQMTGRNGKDAWTVFQGKVYNITPYLPYHPGGEPEMMRCAGRDGTRLFSEVHPWVNWEGMLGECCLGIAVGEEKEPEQEGGGLEDMD